MSIIKFNEDFFFNIIPEVQRICVPIYEQTGYIKFLNHTIIHADSTISSWGTHREWKAKFNEAYSPNSKCITDRLPCGINYWRHSKSQNMSVIQEDARDNYDIDARIEFVYKNEVDGAYHLFSFYADRNNADRAYRFYDIHRGKLLKFISYFCRAAESLIFEGNKPENRINIPSYTYTVVEQTRRSYAKELSKENASMELSDREFEIMILYANGCSSTQIADMLNKSINTVSCYLKIIREKTNCRNKRSLHKYCIEHGWSGLEKFFFNYIYDS
ncbi:response regulator transcription factor [Fangia hongkongensis]|uniref:response regulator transcription factor n=1 Tax=Fangia hongkongensis TaxID=270495 RepID=UPI0003731F51|nr:helix-turn-helix domain-containing protein [Fangia hongkongensis]MBK2125673.1 helix-turn-helix domain-containing protein [Fangia hongkongensis]